jgi:glycosyltransferase involved in cell wall biosynthesis
MAQPASKLRVLYVIDSLAPGGAERSLAALAPNYARLGVCLEVAVLFERGGLRSELEAAGAEVFSLGGRGGRLGAMSRARALILERRPELVHTTLFEADLIGRCAARLTRTIVVSSLVNEAYGPAHSADPGVDRTRLRAAQVLDAITARLCVRLHAVSQRVADVMAQRLQYPKSRIDVVPRGRDPMVLGYRTAQRRATMREQLGVSARDVLVLAVARHDHQKALDRLVEAVSVVRRSVPDVRLLIAGRSGAATSKIRSTIDALGLTGSVTLLGERSDVPDLLCAADVFALPSLREGMPGSVIEAMALEVPVVTSDLPQVREVTGSAALRVPVGDVPALAAAILEVVDAPAAAQQRAAEARRRFLERFTIDQTAREMVAFYRRSLHLPGGSEQLDVAHGE